MKLKLLINGSDYQISVIPENKADKKLLEFVAEHDRASIEVKRKYQYSDTLIESIILTLEVPNEVPTND